MQTFLQDLRYAVRSLCRVPGFTTVAILTLALGTGVNTAIFGVVDLLMLRPLAGVQDSDELVFVMGTRADNPFLRNVSYPNYEDLRDNLEGFDDLLAYSFTTVSLTTADGLAERIYAYTVSANYFDLLGVQMRHGRGFDDAEGLVDTPAAVMADGVHEHQTQWFKDVYIKYGKIPAGRPGQPANIAGPALFLCSEDCAYMTGQILSVDGGITATF